MDEIPNGAVDGDTQVRRLDRHRGSRAFRPPEKVEWVGVAALWKPRSPRHDAIRSAVGTVVSLLLVALSPALVLSRPEPDEDFQPILMQPELTVIGIVLGIVAMFMAIRLGLRARRQFAKLRTSD
jgi:hypothetical protein